MTELEQNHMKTETSSAATARSDAASEMAVEPRIEDVQLCIANVERLMYDSKRVSDPTASALLELALEELMKGWILLAHRTDHVRDAKPKSSLCPEMVTLLSELQQIDVRTAFRTHRPKLEALRHVHLFVKNAAASAPPGGVSGSSMVLAGGLSLDGFQSPQTMDALSKVLSIMKEDEHGRLSEMKESGLYVCLSRRGQFVSPDAVQFLDPQVLAIYDKVVLAFLKGIVKAIIEDPLPPAQRER